MGKMVQREDERQACMAGLQSKQLTQPDIEKHLKDFGVEAESASHTQINQLSGGMKVKAVLAAAMWQNPHILILDEPTNYLDREGLGALVLAIKDYKGGVLIFAQQGVLRQRGDRKVDYEQGCFVSRVSPWRWRMRRRTGTRKSPKSLTVLATRSM